MQTKRVRVSQSLTSEDGSPSRGGGLPASTLEMKKEPSPRKVRRREASLADTDGAATAGEAPTPRQGNWLEMMGHKHTSPGRRSAEQTAN